MLTSMKVQTPTPIPSAGTLLSSGPGAEAEYPWGLQLTLEEPQLAALGLTPLPAFGQTFTLEARVVVTRVGGEADGTRRTLALQITDLALDDGAADRVDRSDAAVAARIYTVPVTSGNGK